EQQHARMKAKLVGFIHPGQVLWSYDDRDTSIPAQYARAIAAYRNGKIKVALNLVDKLIEQEPQNPYFFELKAQMLLEFGYVKDAAKVYRKASNLLPQDPLFQIALAHALIESSPNSGLNNDIKNLEEAINKLEQALQKEPRSTRIHRLLATAYGRLGQENRAKLHLAEEAVLQRHYAYAREHVKAILATEVEGSSTWIKAKDIQIYLEMSKSGGQGLGGEDQKARKFKDKH
ncbi:MAG: tetratricopeptide repeat protein, partial [Alphaproteobacteria bacterium]|nr:tetratricopeptide repeat protein [Alphaproteobacteria bacterium]